MLIVGILFGLGILKLAYEAWFFPDEAAARARAQRNSHKSLFGFNLTEDNKFYRALGKFVSLFLLIMAALMIVVAIRGPFTYPR
jgi:hypothetical protein